MANAEKVKKIVVFVTDGREDLSDPVITDTAGAERLALQSRNATDGEWHTVEFPLSLIEAAPAYARVWEMVPKDIKQAIFDALYDPQNAWIEASIKLAEASK